MLHTRRNASGDATNLNQQQIKALNGIWEFGIGDVVFLFLADPPSFIYDI